MGIARASPGDWRVLLPSLHPHQSIALHPAGFAEAGRHFLPFAVNDVTLAAKLCDCRGQAVIAHALGLEAVQATKAQRGQDGIFLGHHWLTSSAGMRRALRSPTKGASLPCRSN